MWYLITLLDYKKLYGSSWSELLKYYLNVSELFFICPRTLSLEQTDCHITTIGLLGKRRERKRAKSVYLIHRFFELR